MKISSLPTILLQLQTPISLSHLPYPAPHILPRTSYLLLLMVTLCFQVFSQTTDNQKFIEVTGKADTVLQPSLYYYLIEPKVPEDPSYDYSSMSKGDRNTVLQKHKERMQEITKQIKDLLTQEGITEDDYMKTKFEIEDPDIAAKSLVIKVKDTKKLEQLIEKLQAPKFCKGTVAGVYSPKTEEVRKELQLKALKRAKDQATKLLSSVGAKTGITLMVRDKDDPYTAYQNNYTDYNDYGVTTRKLFNPNTFITIKEGQIESTLYKLITISQSVTARFEIVY